MFFHLIVGFISVQSCSEGVVVLLRVVFCPANIVISSDIYHILSPFFLQTGCRKCREASAYLKREVSTSSRFFSL
ncbi:hypothetical protein HMPREF0658_1923 [Hoylesella marshii DSM 16973 = JCM 13450]|uniref:Uncharacterized protein n=1 Tax=Hoylesella marshii DSM 16973 = JCM 13450 TaxID=862515 RepID=E0NUR8_9BACT|nr:hypothetical protein HMPREF0658_1923 [Hoylesella marshii DSM 16973 = JCM 13450]